MSLFYPSAVFFISHLWRKRFWSDRISRQRWGLLQLTGEKGMTLLELLVFIGIIGAVGALGIARVNSSDLNLSTATQQFVGNVRMARANAVSRGTHYQVTLNANSYSIQRLQDDDSDGVWMPDAAFPAQEVDLPNGVSLTFSGTGVIEFSSRGLVVTPTGELTSAVEDVTLSDAHRGGSEQISVWPSGQIQEA